MKALILSVSAGGGHANAALALKNYILQYEGNSQVEILDTIKYINPLLNKLIIGGYLKTLKITPSLFGKIYKHTEKTDNVDGVKSLKNKLSNIMASKILPTIEKLDPDIIICTHYLPEEMVSILKQKNKLDIPLVCILTDHAPHSFWIHPEVDSFIVSNNDMIEAMVKQGVNKNTIFDLGIPVSSTFLTKHNREDTLTKLQLDPNKKTLLIMGGSLGMGRISNIYSKLSTSTAEIQIIVIAGNNKKLYEQLLTLKKVSSVETRILSFTKEVNKYMQCSDLLITKPGGLTISEALICNIPLALFSPIPGQEKKNEEFLLKHNIAITLGDGTNCKETIEKLIETPLILSTMKANCKKFAKPTCGFDIYNLISELIRKKEVAFTENDY